MELYIFRHGNAPGHLGTDFDRELDRRGETEVVSTAQRLKGIEFDLIVSSPLIRACQSKDLITATIGYNGNMETWSEASPGGVLESILQRVELTNASSMLMVSHQPLVSKLVEYLSDERVFMGTASVIGIRMEIVAAHCGDVIFREVR